MATPSTTRRVALVTLGCARNEVDSAELAGRLAAGGWQVVPDVAEADVAVVNTCGFVATAKKDSIDTLLDAADRKTGEGGVQAVVAVGCLAQRYGRELAGELPEVDAVLGFDAYRELPGHLDTLVSGGRVPSHEPSDRRLLLPISPVERPEAADPDAVPGHAGYRLVAGDRVWAPVKIASGCDRRCAFCAIPMFRGSLVSRPPDQVLAEVRALAGDGIREILLVSENSTSYGKDLGDPALLPGLLPQLAAVDGIDRVRVSYLQPAELHPRLVDVLAGTPGVAPYFDLSFQHASGPVLRRMRRFGDAEAFLTLLDRIRSLAPEAGIRSNVILGFPGESEADVELLTSFLEAARLDAVGVFGYSDEDGTEAEGFEDKVPDEEISDRVDAVSRLVDELTAQRAEDRVGQSVRVLVEEVSADGAVAVGRAEHQGPDVDGSIEMTQEADGRLRVGDVVAATVTGSWGVDLQARVG